MALVSMLSQRMIGFLLCSLVGYCGSGVFSIIFHLWRIIHEGLIDLFSILGAYCLIYLSASVNLDCPLSFFTLFFLYYDKSCSPCHILSLLLIFQYFYYARSPRLIIYLFSL